MRNHTLSLKNAFLMLFIPCVLVVVLFVGFLTSNIMTQRSFQRVKRDDLWLVSQLCQSAVYLSDNAERISASLAFDTDLQSILIKYAYGTGDRPDLDQVRQQINKSLVEKGRFNQALYACRNILLFSNEGRLLGSKEPVDMETRLQDYHWAREVEASKGRSIWLPLSNDPHSQSTRNTLSIPVVRKIFSTQSSETNTFEESLTVGKPLGYLLVYFDNSMFSDIVSQYSSSAKRFFLTDPSRIISSQDPADIGKTFSCDELPSGYVRFNGQQFLMTTMDIPERGWIYICLTYRSEVEHDRNLLTRMMMGISLLLIVVFVLMGLILDHITAKPIGVLVDAFHRAEKGKARIDKRSGIREFDALYDSFNHTMDRIHQLATEVYEARMEKQELVISMKESKIRALQNQINPHFLYNTLDSINWKARIAGDKEVSDMIVTLGKFFRSNISTDANEIPISEELENIRLYISLSKYRFGEKLHCSVSCQTGIEGLPILRLLLQPLIENSIKHGIEVTGDPEHIETSLILNDQTLIVEVKDNGAGMDEETLSELRTLWKHAGEDYRKTNKIGLYNVFRRLALTYYHRVNVVINSKLGKGTTVSIFINMGTSKKTE